MIKIEHIFSLKSVCQEVGGGLHGLLAWQPQNLLQLLASTASYLTLPIIIVDSSTKAGHLLDTPVFALNLAPDPATVGHALSALIALMVSTWIRFSWSATALTISSC